MDAGAVTKVNAAVELGRVRHQGGPIVRDWSEQTGRKGGVGCCRERRLKGL